MSFSLSLPPEVIELIAERAADIAVAKLAEAQTDRWLDVTGAAAHLGCSEGRIRKLVERRGIPFSQDGPGCRVFFSRRALDRWMEDRGGR